MNAARYDGRVKSRQRPWPSDQRHLDEVAVLIGNRRFWLGRAVDSEGEILDLLVQPKRDKAAAVRLMRKLLKKQSYAPRVLVTERSVCFEPMPVSNGTT